jgi:hypothetical protein
MSLVRISPVEFLGCRLRSTRGQSRRNTGSIELDGAQRGLKETHMLDGDDLPRGLVNCLIHCSETSTFATISQPEPLSKPNVVNYSLPSSSIIWY